MLDNSKARMRRPFVVVTRPAGEVAVSSADGAAAIGGHAFEAAARSIHERRVDCEFDKSEIGREAYPTIDGKIGIGAVVVAFAWLAFFVIAIIHSLAFGN